MNGASAEPCVKIISPPRRMRKNKIGASHHFLRTFKKSHNSDKIESLLIVVPKIVFRIEIYRKFLAVVSANNWLLISQFLNLKNSYR